MSIVGVALNLNLGLMWGPGYMSTTFNDYSYFNWAFCLPPSTAVWYSNWDSSGASLPSKYAGLQVVADASKYTWTLPWGTPAPTFTMPAGPATLLQVMTAIYTATLQTITAAQYQNITGNIWTAATSPSMGRAFVDYLAPMNATPTFYGLNMSPGVILIQD